MGLLMDQSLKDFNSLLASNEPAPGGGSAAALCGLFGASLAMMVVSLSINKKAFEALEKNVKEKISENFEALKTLSEELKQQVEDDTKAFNQFMEAVKMPKETECEKAKREEAQEKAGLYALEVPLATAEKCLNILKRQALIGKYGNKNAASDIGVGVLMAFAGLEGAALNVRINLPGIKNENAKGKAKELIEVYVREGRKRKEEIMEIVYGRIG